MTPEQVVMSLRERYPAEIDAILARYPAGEKRSAVMPLIFMAQREQGFVAGEAIDEIAQLLDISSTQVASIVGFYTLFYANAGGMHRIQICTDLPCALRGADEFAEQVCENMGVKMGETTADGHFTVEAVMCLAACDKAPMFQVQSRNGLRYYERQSADDVNELVKELCASRDGRGETVSE